MDIAEALHYLRSNHRSVLITRRPNGDPSPAPVVHAVDDRDRVVISTREPAYKVRNVRRDPRTTLCAFTEHFFGEWVTVDGRAEVITLPEAMDGLVSIYRQISGEHPDWNDYRQAMERERRVILAITPERAGPDRQA